MTQALPIAQVAKSDEPTEHFNRYGRIGRGFAAIIVGVVAGILLLLSVQTGVGLALEGSRLQRDNWFWLQWGNHWMWRGVASVAVTFAASFLCGMIARRRGATLAMVAAIPTIAFWAFIAYVGWRNPSSASDLHVPIAYRIIATLLVLATLPIAASGGAAGEPYGRANAAHFDERRWTLLGISWYHYLWLPVLIHLMIVCTAFGAVYGFQWLALAWKSGMSFFVFIPIVFYVAMFSTLSLVGQGAFRTYEALAGFDDDSGLPRWKKVLKYGFGFTALAALAQIAIVLLHSGMAKLAQRISG
jgi:hypothetical protein